MRFRTFSRVLVSAVLAGGVGCGGRARQETTVVNTAPVIAAATGWTRVSVPAVLDRHVRFPADARGVYLRTPSCTNCFEVVRGPAFIEACGGGASCAAPMAADPYADRLLVVTAHGQVEVVPWSALAPVVDELTRTRGAAGRDDPELAVLRTLRDGGRLARRDAWVEITADGAFRIVDGFPPELGVGYDAWGREHAPGTPLPAGVSLSIASVQPRLARDDAGQHVVVESGDPLAAALARASRLLGDELHGSYSWVMLRPMARGVLVTFGAGPGCMGSQVASVVVEDDVPPIVVDQRDLGIPDACHPRGRRPAGLASLPADDVDIAGDERSTIARWFAEATHLEAASVPAFERLAAELAELGGPPRLVRAARAAARDELRHATTMARLGARAGAASLAVVIEPVLARTLETIAIENAVEGCVNEGFAAVLCAYQARAAADPALASALETIASDEHTHAGLAFAIAGWLASRLPPSARSAVDDAIAVALDRLPARAAAESSRFAAAATALGLPSPGAARELAAGYAAWARAELYSMVTCSRVTA